MGLRDRQDGLGADSPPPAEGVRIALARDEDCRGWAAFAPWLGEANRSAGAVLLVERGGCVRGVWTSAGHAREVLEAAGAGPARRGRVASAHAAR